MTSKSGTAGAGEVVKTVVTALVFLIVVVFLMMWLAGAFHPKVSGDGRSQFVETLVGDAPLEPVRVISMPSVEAAVGTIGAVQESNVASKILAKVVRVNVVAGKRVSQGDVLINLEDEDLLARYEQANSAVSVALSTRDQARIEHDRVTSLLAEGAAAPIERDRTATALRSAEAELKRLQQSQSEAQTILDYATIRAPIGGVVVDKLVEEGDTVSPGQVLVTLYDPGRMQLVATVRESLAHRLSVGHEIQVEVDALEKRCSGLISEIVPKASAASRSFDVKVTGPCPPGIYSGMFGRILIPLGNREVVVVPKACIQRVGQLDIVYVAEESGDGLVFRRRSIVIGKSYDDMVEVLSGLNDGEQVSAVVPPTHSGEGV